MKAKNEDSELGNVFILECGLDPTSLQNAGTVLLSVQRGWSSSFNTVHTVQGWKSHQRH